MVNILFLILAVVLLAVSVFSLYSYLKDIRRTKRVFIKIADKCSASFIIHSAESGTFLRLLS
ncbi:hypothetical protein DMH27_10700 [Raoultella planticola]|nr:hypothetical protein [Raoultella planticola]